MRYKGAMLAQHDLLIENYYVFFRHRYGRSACRRYDAVSCSSNFLKADTGIFDMKCVIFVLSLLSAPVSSQELTAPVPSKARFLTSEAGSFDEWPCFSPDGNSILFSRSVDKGKTWEFFLVSADGGEAKRFVQSPLPLSVSATRAAWSARTNLIAFTGVSNDGIGSLWFLDSQGTQARPFVAAAPTQQAFYPSWYPDGRRLVVMDAKDLVLKSVDRESGAIETITDRNRIFTGMPSVSPDGKSIAFAGQVNAGQPYDQNKNSIWLIGKTGEPHVVEHESLQGRAPTWSPDGRRIVFESNRGSGRFYAVFVIGADGTGATQITEYNLNATHPVWSPRSKEIVFSARQSNGQMGTGIAIADVP